MATSTIVSAWTLIVPQVLSGKENYKSWSGCIKNYLLAQDLWDIIETSMGDDDDIDEVRVELKDWRRKNAATLHAIQMSCGMNILPEIEGISSAKTVWHKLAETYDEQPVQADGSNFQSTRFIPEYANFYYYFKMGIPDIANILIKKNPDSLRAKITHLGQTALHVAILARNEEMVKWLVEKKMSKEDLEIRDNEGLTALDLTIIHDYDLQLVKLIVEKNPELLTIGNNLGLEIPIVLALRHERPVLANYLSDRTPFDKLQPKIGATVVTKAIHTGNYGLASRVIRSHPDLAYTRDTDNVFPVSVFFGTTSVLWSIILDELRGEPNKWSQLRRMVYSRMHVSSPPPNFLKYYLDYLSKPGEAGTSVGSGQMQSIQNTQYRRLLLAMLDTIFWRRPEEIEIESGIVGAIFGAVRAGMVGFIGLAVVCVRTDALYRARDGKRRNVLMSAVQHRQPEIFGLIYDSLKEAKAKVLASRDNEGNNILHVAGTFTEFSPLDHITGAALKMQTELQWFQAVEDLCNPMYMNERNYDGLTPKQVFMQTHKELMKEGERWMKDTASSCAVVGALIVTITFAAVFAVPGGNNQNTGFPIFLNRKLFKIFIIADSLSLISSSISILMFLEIVSSPYEAEHFVKSLPTKMIILHSTLFFSIATMMMAFSCAILMMMRGELWLVIPLVGLASVPIFMYVFIQSRILVDMIVKTYGFGTIYGKIKSGYAEYKSIITMMHEYYF